MPTNNPMQWGQGLLNQMSGMGQGSTASGSSTPAWQQFKTGDPPFWLGIGPGPQNSADPGQAGRWSWDIMSRLASDLYGQQLYDPATMSRLQSAFDPMFNQQRQALTQSYNSTLGNQMGIASRSAAAQAAMSGLNPSSFVNKAQAGVRGQLTPGYFNQMGQLQADQGKMLMGGANQAGQFSANNLGNLLNTYAGVHQGGMKQFGLENQGQASWWEGALAGLMQGAGTAAGAALLV